MDEVGLSYKLPRYIEEVEALLGTSFFYDEDRSDALREDMSLLEPIELAARSLLYTRALRILAEERYEDRQVWAQNNKNKRASFDADAWGLTFRRLAGIALRQREVVNDISRDLAMINNAEEDRQS